MSTITLGSNTYTLVTLPANPGFVDLTLTMDDTVAVVQSPFVPSQVQTQAWPGADGWKLQGTLPKMPNSVSGPWIGFLAALRGRANVFQAGDPTRTTPLGKAQGAPVVNGTISGGNAVSAYALNTRGWHASVYRQLLPGDYLQIVNRLYIAVAEVDSDGSGNAVIQIWPSLRETPADGAAIKLINPVGVFRLAGNSRPYHRTVDGLVQVSLQATEAR